MQTFDVTVIGAGLAGLHCARLLARSGLQVLLVDRKPTLDQAIHTTGIFVRRTLEDFDLPEECLGPPVRQVRLYSPARRVMQLESPHDEFRIGRMGLLYTRYLEDCRRLGVVWSPSTSYLGSEEQAQGSIAHLRTGGRDWAARTRMIVGADGASSRVARDLDLDVNQHWIVGLEEVLDGVPLAGSPCFHCFLDPKLAPGYLAWLVHDGEEAHIGVGGYPGRFDPGQALHAFKEIAGQYADLSRAQVRERRGGRIPVGGILNRIGNRRGLLVGDAAGAVSPLTAGGLDPCLRLAELAARVIEDYLATGAPEALAAYSGKPFRGRFRVRLLLRWLLARMQSPAVLEAACALLRLPLLHALAWQVFFGRGSFPDTSTILENFSRKLWPGLLAAAAERNGNQEFIPERQPP